MKREDQLLLICARPTLRPEHTHQIRQLLERPLIWDQIIQNASQEGLAGLLHAHLKDLDAVEVIPDWARGALKKSYYTTLAYNGYLKEELRQVFRVFENHSISVMLLQGMALLDKVYASPGMRPMCDIDLLVRPEDMAKILKELTNLGYFVLTRYPLVCAKDGVKFDLHTEVAYLSRIGVSPRSPIIESEPLWRNAVPWDMGFQDVRILSPIDQLLYLSAHLQKHSFSRLIWFADIVGLLERTPPISWEEMVQRADRLKLKTPTYFVLSYIKHVLQGPSDDTALDLLKPGRLGVIERYLHTQLLRNIRVPGSGDVLFFLGMGSRLDQVSFLIRTAFPKPDVLKEIRGSRHIADLLIGYPRRALHLLALGLRFLISVLRRVLQRR